MFDKFDPQILVLAALALAWLARTFYNVFMRQPPAGKSAAPGTPAPRSDLRDFLEELRRDLGHGTPPKGETAGPSTEGLLDPERAAAPKEEREERGLMDRQEPIPSFPRRPEPRPFVPAPYEPAPYEPSPYEKEPQPPDILRPAVHPEAHPARRPKRTGQAVVLGGGAAESRTAEIQDYRASAIEQPDMGIEEIMGIDEAERTREDPTLLGIDATQGFILAEVLGRPRAFRPYRRRN